MKKVGVLYGGIELPLPAITATESWRIWGKAGKDSAQKDGVFWGNKERGESVSPSATLFVQRAVVGMGKRIKGYLFIDFSSSVIAVINGRILLLVFVATRALHARKFSWSRIYYSAHWNCLS